jgi:serine/threonine protein kinase
MELCEITLHDWIKDNYDKDQALDFIQQLIEGLIGIHSKGLIHKDIKVT